MNKNRIEKSAEAVVVSGKKILAKGRRNRRRRPVIIGNGLSQMFAVAKLADMVNRVKPEGPRSEKPDPPDCRSAASGCVEGQPCAQPVSYTHLRAHETDSYL